MLNWLYMAAGILMLGVLQLAAAIPFSGAGAGWASAFSALAAAALIGCVSFALWNWIALQQETFFAVWPSLAMAVMAVLLGSLLKQAAFGSRTTDWLAAPLLAGATAATLYWLKNRVKLVACSVCKRGVRVHETTVCPRCREHVCLRGSCWETSASRCTVCLDRGVIRFPLSDQWWSVRVGRRVAEGECILCFRSARETDLRECGRCHFPTCRRCWDHLDGRCSRCQWEIPDLSPQLRPGRRRLGRSLSSGLPRRG